MTSHAGVSLTAQLSTCAILCLLAGLSYSAPTYTITDISPPASQVATGAANAFAINDVGQVVGNYRGAYFPGAPTGAFLWDGTSHDLGSLGGMFPGSTAYGINNARQVVGNSATAGGGQRGFLWDAINGMVAIPVDTGYGINSSGQIAGNLGFVDPVTGLHALAGAGFAINSAGQVVGAMGNHATLWDSANGLLPMNLEPLGSDPSFSSNAEAINNVGQVVGYNRTGSPGGLAHAFIWDAVNGMRGLPDLAKCAGRDHTAHGINDSGVAVGLACGTDLLNYAVMWDSTGAVDLTGQVTNLAGWDHLTQAFAINDAGQIVGAGETIGGDLHAFLLTPIPIPAGLLLFPSALAGLGWVRRKNAV